jgi:hypothetical protein
MIRFFLWILLFFIVYRVIRSIAASGFGGWSKGERPSHDTSPPEFKNVQDAEFEDLSDKEERKP